MDARYLDLDISLERQLALHDIRLADLEAIRLLLRGGSIVDWYRLNFKTVEEVHAFLRVNRYEPDDPQDEARLRGLVRSAASYLERNFGYSFPPELVEPARIEDPFLLPGSGDPYEKLACMMLKVLHILNHIDSMELRYQLPVSDQELFAMVEQEVTRWVGDLQAAHLGIHDYKASRKTRDSLVTKLLSKRRTLAAQVYDKLRFRVVTERRADLLPVLRHMTQHLVPFNYVVPEESRNDILNFREMLEGSPRLRGKIAQLQFDLRLEEQVRPVSEDGGGLQNPSTATDYRVINFVVDFPLRIDGLLSRIGEGVPLDLGRIVYLQVEFQLFDQDTWERNEASEANHDAYKKRQRRLVLQRLVRGMPLFLRDEEGEQRPGVDPLALRMQQLAQAIAMSAGDQDDDGHGPGGPGERT
ncbi:MAG: hypothetical protein AMXMBFR64_27170 [Myxococcales bacterium]